MNHLVLMRGPMGAGKSTFIKEHNLEQYTLSADAIRLMYQTPILKEDGITGISIRNDSKVWATLMELLEARMARGEFTVIDATHVKTEAINNYRKLAQKYRYRVTVVEFNVSEEELLKRNQLRESHKQIPQGEILNAIIRMDTETVPSWVTKITPDELDDHIQFKPMDFSKYENIHVIGDIQGCYDPLMAYIGENKALNPNDLYIFTGDYLDRGPQNGEVFKWLLTVYMSPNVILLRGNHEAHIESWGNGDTPNSTVFMEETLPQLEAAGITQKDMRMFIRKLRVCAYFTYHGKTFIATHGGLPLLPDNLMLIASHQLIHGVGDYEIDIDKVWATNMPTDVVQLHGHRNIFRLNTMAESNSFNLEGQVEDGKHLRIIKLTNGAVSGVYGIKNDNFIDRHKPSEASVALMDLPEVIEQMQNHELIKSNPIDEEGRIHAFNFTKKAFKSRKWDELNMHARGLFIDLEEEAIVSRSYNKFFNINERPETRIGYLADNFQFPVCAYEKSNGYLGILGYDFVKDELFFSSKSQANGPHAQWFKELFYAQTYKAGRAKVLRLLKDKKLSLVFEVIKVQEDPHIIEYKQDRLVLLDAIYRDINFDKMPYEEMYELFGGLFEVKRLSYRFDDWISFYRWYQIVSTDNKLELEGYVIEDASGFMTKMKLPYYNFWKEMRGIKESAQSKHIHNIRRGALRTPEHNRIFKYIKDIAEAEEGRNRLKQMSIIDLRNEYYQMTGAK